MANGMLQRNPLDLYAGSDADLTVGSGQPPRLGGSTTPHQGSPGVSLGSRPRPSQAQIGSAATDEPSGSMLARGLAQPPALSPKPRPSILAADGSTAVGMAAGSSISSATRALGTAPLVGTLGGRPRAAASGVPGGGAAVAGAGVRGGRSPPHLGSARRDIPNSKSGPSSEAKAGLPHAAQRQSSKEKFVRPPRIT